MPRKFVEMIVISKHISAAVQAGKRILKSLGFGRSDVQESFEVSPWGVDSNPLPDTVSVRAQTSTMGETVVFGYVFENKIAEPGETRFFSTDGDGNEVAYVYMRKSGDLELNGTGDNAVRFSELKTGFEQLKSDYNNFLIAFNTHTHPTAAPGPVSPPTPIPGSIPATASTASIDGAKVDTVLLPE